MAAWGERWIEVEPRHCDPGFALWAWCRVRLDRRELPPGRVVAAFHFPDQPRGDRDYWLLVDDGDAEVCHTDPGGEPEPWVRSPSPAFVDWHRGRRSWADVTADGELTIHGRTDLVRSFPRWNRRAPSIQ